MPHHIRIFHYYNHVKTSMQHGWLQLIHSSKRLPNFRNNVFVNRCWLTRKYWKNGESSIHLAETVAKLEAADVSRREAEKETHALNLKLIEVKVSRLKMQLLRISAADLVRITAMQPCSLLKFQTSSRCVWYHIRGVCITLHSDIEIQCSVGTLRHVCFGINVFLSINNTPT